MEFWEIKYERMNEPSSEQLYLPVLNKTTLFTGSVLFILCVINYHFHFQMVHPRCVYITSLMKCRRQSHTQQTSLLN